MNNRDTIEAALRGAAGWGDSDRVDRLLAGHRAEVLAEDGQAYDGELAMLRDLVRTLRVAARPDDADLGEIRRLLHHHATDDAAARAANNQGDSK